MSLEKIPLRQVDTNVVYTFSYTGNLFEESLGHRLYNDSGRNRNITSIRSSVGTPSEGSAIKTQVNLNSSAVVGAMVLQPGDYTEEVANLTVNWPAGSYLTVAITQTGTTIPGADLTINVVVSE